MRLLRSGIVGIAACIAVLIAAVPCWACSCVARSDAEHFEAADVVFTGHATARRDTAPPGPTQGSADPIVWTFHVQSVQKGRAAQNQEVSTTRDEASCGVEFAIDSRYQVFARSVDGRLHTGLCDGTRKISEDAQPYRPAAATPVATAPPPPPSAPATATPAFAPSPAPSPSASPTPSPLLTPRPSAAAFPSPIAAAPRAGDGAWPAVAVLLVGLTGLGAALALARRSSGGP